MNEKLNSWQHNLRIFWALLRRDLYVLRTDKLKDLIIDTCIILGTEYITFVGLFPSIGVPQEKIPSIYLGTIVGMVLFHNGYSFAIQIVYNIPYRGFGITEYHLTLPIQKRWLFAEYIIYYMIEALILSLPLILFGLYFINGHSLAVAGNWFLFLFIYLFILLFFGVFFLSCAFVYNHAWFRENMWARRLSWMICFGPVFFSWEAIRKISPIFANVILINPVTPIMESMRASLLAQSPFNTPVWFLGICFWIGISIIRLKQGIYKQLDPV